MSGIGFATFGPIHGRTQRMGGAGLVTFGLLQGWTQGGGRNGLVTFDPSHRCSGQGGAGVGLPHSATSRRDVGGARALRGVGGI